MATKSGTDLGRVLFWVAILGIALVLSGVVTAATAPEIVKDVWVGLVDDLLKSVSLGKTVGYVVTAIFSGGLGSALTFRLVAADRANKSVKLLADMTEAIAKARAAKDVSVLPRVREILNSNYGAIPTFTKEVCGISKLFEELKSLTDLNAYQEPLITEDKTIVGAPLNHLLSKITVCLQKLEENWPAARERLSKGLSPSCGA